MRNNVTSYLNIVKNRFISLPKSAVEGLEHEPQKSDFDFIKELGIGSFGTVYLVSHKKTKAKYALKAIDKTVPENLEEKANFNREVEIMYKLNHPNIVKLYGHFEDERYCYFIMQYIPNKSLFALVPTDGRKPNVKLIASVMKDLLSAVYYLHNMKPTIIHRDIKPENILLDNNNKAYLTDFGWSNYMMNFIRRNTTCGTPLYLPPEMVAQIGHDETADIWCIGVLLFELVTGNTPFEGNDVETVASNIISLNITWPPKIDPDAKDLISKILKLYGKDRLTIEQILSHKFFSKYFPNAIKELIKPETQKNRTFIVSKDTPQNWEKQTNKTSYKPQNNNKIVQNIINIKKNEIKKINNINYRNNNVNKENINSKIKKTIIPKVIIDLSKSRGINKPNHSVRISLSVKKNNNYSNNNRSSRSNRSNSLIKNNYNKNTNSTQQNSSKIPKIKKLILSPTNSYRNTFKYKIDTNFQKYKHNVCQSDYRLNSSRNSRTSINNTNPNNYKKIPNNYKDYRRTNKSKIQSSYYISRDYNIY